MDNEFDFESRYFPMGARMYDARIGRFLSVDPLFEKFRNQSPYNYAFNSPMVKSDPSGLAPKGEKNKDKLLEIKN
jgi:RHS repeat-associated protein